KPSTGHGICKKSNIRQSGIARCIACYSQSRNKYSGMSDSIATYTFLPWLRQGVSNKIDPANVTASRATVQVKLKLTGKALQGADLEHEIVRNVELYGPGDIIGIDKKAIVRNEPRNWITNFESNYMPYVEFYDEDFPWRYSPSVVQEHDRLTPWMALVV